MSDDLVKRLRGWDHCWPARWLENAVTEAADRIEELEASNKLLNEQLDSIEEYGNEALNALPDCLMQLAPALVENDELKAKLAKAVKLIELAVELVQWNLNPKFRDAMIEFTTTVNGENL